MAPKAKTKEEVVNRIFAEMFFPNAEVMDTLVEVWKTFSVVCPDGSRSANGKRVLERVEWILRYYDRLDPFGHPRRVRPSKVLRGARASR